jgi:hypothetical protein
MKYSNKNKHRYKSLCLIQRIYHREDIIRGRAINLYRKWCNQDKGTNYRRLDGSEFSD